MKYLLFLLLLPQLSLANEAFIGYGVGIFHDADTFLGQNKYAEVGYRNFFYKGMYLQFKGGFWGEGSSDITRKSGFWGSVGPGLEMDLNPLEIRSGYGLGMISTPDSQLGAHFPEFNGEIYVGLKDKRNDEIGLQYEHLSCADFCSPNQGRDFITVQLSTRW